MIRQEAPDFIIVGAAKAGTTLLWNWLNSHSHTFMPKVKEPHYFSFGGMRVPHRGAELDPFYRASLVTSRAKYQDLWLDAPKGHLRGEASPGYLYFPESAKRIFANNPQTRIIAIFRDPAARAFSQFMHHLRDGYETTFNFETALALEQHRIAKGWWWGFHYEQTGYYAAQWRRYVDIFPEEQLLPLLFDELKFAPAAAYAKVCDFLGLKIEAPDLHNKVNATDDLKLVPIPGPLTSMLRHGSSITHLAHRLLPAHLSRRIKNGISRFNARAAPKFDVATQMALRAKYSSDVMRLAKMIDRDLSPWIDPMQVTPSGELTPTRLLRVPG